MRSGTIELPSGRWYWTLIDQWTGATVVYQHRDRSFDEMRSWTARRELTPTEVEELGRDALERTWLDRDGLKWRLTLELPVAWRRSIGDVTGDDLMCLTFQRVGVKRAAEVPGRAQLGEYTHTELDRLLAEALRVP